MSISLTFCMLFVLVTLSFSQPALLADKNLFLKDFIGSNLLNVLGVVLAITLASSAQLHLEFNKAEERYGRLSFVRSRAAIRGANMTLIVIFVLAVAGLIAKAAIAGGDKI